MAIAGFIPFVSALTSRLESNITGVTFTDIGDVVVPTSSNVIVGEIDIVPISRSVLEIGPNPSMQFNFILNTNLRSERGSINLLRAKAREILEEFTTHELITVTESGKTFSTYVVDKDYAPVIRTGKQLYLPVNITFGSLQSGS